MTPQIPTGCPRMRWDDAGRHRCGQPTTHLVRFGGTDDTGAPLGFAWTLGTAMCRECAISVEPPATTMHVIVTPIPQATP